LAIIPALHIGLFVTQGQRLSAANVLGIVIRSAIIAFSLLIRATFVMITAPSDISLLSYTRLSAQSGRVSAPTAHCEYRPQQPDVLAARDCTT
jgi:hypothetical protein